MLYGSEDTSSMAIGASSTLCPPLPSSTATAPGVPDLRSPAPAAPLPSRHSPASPSPAPGQQTQGITPELHRYKLSTTLRLLHVHLRYIQQRKTPKMSNEIIRLCLQSISLDRIVKGCVIPSQHNLTMYPVLFHLEGH
ncbi:hypothetical protein KUCAC02_035305 [Chaenocephalus aceratus]|nr:hypothetical protein KUCAC02_035305 [Chaenocephalus aceratus]